MTRQDKTRQDKNENSCSLIPCCIDKNKPDGSYGKLQDAKLCDIGTPIARTLVTHEPGLTNHHCNMVIVKMNKDKHPIFLGNYNGFGTSYAGAVYSKKGIAPTLNTMQGGGA